MLQPAVQAGAPAGTRRAAAGLPGAPSASASAASALAAASAHPSNQLFVPGGARGGHRLAAPGGHGGSADGGSVPHVPAAGGGGGGGLSRAGSASSAAGAEEPPPTAAQLRASLEEFRRRQNAHLLGIMSVEVGIEHMRARAYSHAGTATQQRRLLAVHSVQREEARARILQRALADEADTARKLKELGVRTFVQLADAFG
jgi:hypothetical protein